MIPFLLRATVTTPVALRRPLHLDGLLTEAFWRDPGDATEAKLPIAMRDGIAIAGAAWLEGGRFGVAMRRMLRVKALVTEALPSPAFYADPALGKAGRAIGPMSPMRQRLTPYPIYEGVRALWWPVVGDPDACLALANRITNLGGMANTGYGCVDVWSVEEVETVDDDFALLQSNGAPCRVLPLDLWKKWAGKEVVPYGAVVTTARPCPPYWTGEEQVCVCPTLSALIKRKSDILQVFDAA